MDFITSDPHFHHNNIIKYCNRPFKTVDEMDSAILARLNERVKPDDTLYLLGDFMFGPKNIETYSSMVMDFRNRIACQEIHLILGNHDRRKPVTRTLKRSGKIITEMVPLDCYYEAFDSVSAVKEITVNGKLYTLCHYPYVSWNKSHRNAISLYGHHHLNIDKQWRQGLYGHSQSVMSMDVGVDGHDFYPWLFDEIEAIMATKTPNPQSLDRKPGHYRCGND